MINLTEKKATIILLVVAIVWGTGFICVDLLLDAGFPIFQILAGRFFIGATILSIVFRKKIANVTKEDLKGSFVVGALLTIAFGFQIFGQAHSSPSINAFVTATYVVLVPTISYFFLNGKMDKFEVLASVLTLLGISLIAFSGNSTGTGSNMGILLTLLGALGFALQIISVEYYTKTIDPIIVTIFMFWTACILSTIVSIIIFAYDGKLPNLSSTENIINSIGPLVFLGVFSTSIAFLGQNVAQGYTSATNTAILLSLESVFAAIFSVLYLNEQLSPIMIMGFIIVFSAILIAELKPNLKIFTLGGKIDGRQQK